MIVSSSFFFFFFKEDDSIFRFIFTRLNRSRTSSTGSIPNKYLQSFLLQNVLNNIEYQYYLSTSMIKIKPIDTPILAQPMEPILVDMTVNIFIFVDLEIKINLEVV
jgi:hypothetical protein